MKKLSVIIFFLIYSGFVFSQDETDSYRPFRFGLKAEPNIGWLKPETSTYKYKKPALGFAYGIMMDIGLGSNNYALYTGLDVVYFGGTIEYPNYVLVDNIGYIGRSETKYSLQYLNVPLHLKLKTNEIGYLTYFAHMGIDAGIKLKSNASVNNTLSGATSQFEYSEKKIDVSNETKLFRPAMCIGIGAEYNISGNTSFVFGASFHNGFTNIFSKNKVVYKVDNKGNVLTNPVGSPLKDDKKAHALTNYIALTVGVFF